MSDHLLLDHFKNCSCRTFFVFDAGAGFGHVNFEFSWELIFYFLSEVTTFIAGKKLHIDSDIEGC